MIGIPERYDSARVVDENMLSIEANPTREADTRRALEQHSRDSGVNELRTTAAAFINEWLC